jgi:hypothetical protein
MRACVGRLWRRKVDRARLDRAQKQKGAVSSGAPHGEKDRGAGGVWHRQERAAVGPAWQRP